jgi:uncharacterized protein DUF4157
MSELTHPAASTTDAAPAQAPAKDDAASPGTGSAVAAMAADAAKDGSGGRPLEGGTRAKMERAFGSDFSNVKVHTDGAANQAAQNLDAHAFADGADLFFDQGAYDPGSQGGEHLIAHELAHVVQSGGTPGAVATKSAASTPTDAHEVAADRAADRAVKGESVGDVGSAPSGMLHRDAIGDLRSAADGNWVGSVDDGKVLARTRALSDAERTALKTDSKYDGLNRRIMKKLSATNCLEYLRLIGGLDVRWKLYWLNEGNNLDELSREQWHWLLGYTSPQVMDLLRQYPSGYRSFLKNAPLDLIPPWDRLQGLVDGSWHGSAADIRNACANLNAEQKAKLRGDTGKLVKIMFHCGDANEQFRVTTYLQLQPKWAVFYLDAVKALPKLTNAQWSEMLSECSRTDYDELVGWGVQWALVQKYCPPGIIQVTRQNSDDTKVAASFDDPVQIDAMFGTLGSAGFLAAATKVPLAPQIDDIYGKIQARNKIDPTVDGLTVGVQMAPETKSNLRKWFFTPKSTPAECKKMFEQRFRVKTDGPGSVSHVNEKQGDGVTPVQLATFSKEGLSQMWRVCEALPPAAVENNPELLYILRDKNNWAGNAYYAGDGQGKQGDILMGGRNDTELHAGVGGSGDNIYQAGGAGAGTPPVTMTRFTATLRHEIGHAVDSQLKISDTWGRQIVAGNWTKYDSYDDFVDAIIASSGGLKYGDKKTNSRYRDAMIDAVKNRVPISTIAWKHGITGAIADSGDAVSTVFSPDRYSDNASGPWYNHRWVTQGGRNFQTAYNNDGSLYSFLAGERTRRKITDYQWRAPGEWFAEVYQVYYSEQEGQEAGPPKPVGGRLRQLDPEAAQMMSQLVDRGFSPQQMKDGTTTKTPGT